MKKFLRLMSAAAGASILVSMFPMSVWAAKNSGKVRVIVRNDTFSVSDGADWDGVLIDESVTIDESSNAFNILVSAIEKNGYECVGADSGYISSVNGLDASDGGSMGGWMASLDDWIVDDALSSFTVSSGKLEDGDEICFSYSCDWGADLGYDWSGTDTSLSSLTVDGGTLSPDFSGGNTTYTLSLEEDTSEISIYPQTLNKAFRTKIYKNDYTPAEQGKDYKFGESIPVNDGDIIYVGVANSLWMSYVPDGVSETVYKISVNSPAPSIDTDVQSVISQIDSLDNEDTDLQKVKAVRKAYDALSSEQKSMVTNYEKLLNAEKKYTDTDGNCVNIIGSESEMKNIFDTVYPNMGSAGNEWQIITLSRYNLLSEEVKKEYAESVKKYVNSVGSSKLSSTLSTDNSKMVLALTAVGVDPTDIDGYNLVEPLYDVDYVGKQGINGIIYALIAIDSHNYCAEEENGGQIKENYINSILSAQLDDGGWTIFGDQSDADVTSIALQALAPYYSSDEKVKQAVDKALLYLSGVQNNDGSFSSFGMSNAESTAQAIIALTSLNIDIYTDMRFIKDGNTVLDGLCGFIADDVYFSHTAKGEANTLSTVQGYLAVTALYRQTNGYTSLYDMSDVTFDKGNTESSKSESVKDLAQNESSVPPKTAVVSETGEKTAQTSSSVEVIENIVNTGDTQQTAYVAVFSVMMLSASVYMIIMVKSKSVRLRKTKK